MFFWKIDDETIRCLINKEEIGQMGFDLKELGEDNEQMEEFLNAVIADSKNYIEWNTENGVQNYIARALPSEQFLITISCTFQDVAIDRDLDQILADIEKQFGKGSIMCLGENSHMKIDVVSSGCLSLDVALGVGGYPKGRIIEIYGPESSGKTTFALQAIAEVQKTGGRAAFIDAEHALDPEYARNLGVQVDDLLISQPDTGEQALDITEELVRSGAVDVIVVDSVAALVPKAEIEGSMEDQQMGLQARLMSKALRKLTGIIGKTRTTVIFINQLRQKIGVMYGNCLLYTSPSPRD